jgi:hypothetical protein
MMLYTEWHHQLQQRLSQSSREWEI